MSSAPVRLLRARVRLRVVCGVRFDGAGERECALVCVGSALARSCASVCVHFCGAVRESACALACARGVCCGRGVTWYDRHDRRIYGVETKPDLLLPLKVDRLGELQMLPKLLRCGATSCAALRHAALAAVAIRNIALDR